MPASATTPVTHRSATTVCCCLNRQHDLHYAEPRYHGGSGSKVWLMTRRSVVAEEELLVNYGAKAYWEVIA